MKNEIIVQENIKLRVDEIYQWHTYSGYLIGLPSIEINNKIIENTRLKAIEYCGNGKAYLIDPIQTVKYAKLNFKNSIALPSITCVATLYCSKPIKEGDGSRLNVIWFQNDFAFPLETEINQQFKLLKWNELAEDFCF